MRQRQKVNVQLFADSTEEDILLAGDDDASEVIIDGNVEASIGRGTLTAGEDLDVPFGAVGTAAGIFIKATGDFSLVLNGGEPLACKRQVRAAAGGAKAATCKFFFEGTLATAVVTCGASAITLTYAVFGDPAS